MAYSKPTLTIAPRHADLAYEEIGPGLYHDEMLVEVDGGELVAVSVERHWLDNGAGTAFKGFARWIEQDGTTKTAPNGAHVEAQLTHLSDPVQLREYTEDAIATEIALAVLGEEPKLMKGDTGVAVIGLDDTTRVGSSIVHQIRAVNATKSTFIGL